MTPRNALLVVVAVSGVLAAGVALLLETGASVDSPVASPSAVATDRGARAADSHATLAVRQPAEHRELSPAARGTVRAPSVVLRGHVRSASGLPVAGAILRRLEAHADNVVMPDGTRGVAVAVTDAVGAFHVEQLDRGAWRLLITSECHPDTVESGVTEQVGQVIAGLEFVLEDALEIGGRVEGVLAAAADGLWVRAMAVPTGELPPGTSRRAADELAAVPRRVRCAPDGSFVVRGLRQHTTYRLAAADSGVWFGPTRSPWVEARVGAVDVVLACRPRAAVVFQVLDGQTSAPLTDLEVRAGYRCMLPVTGRDGQVQRHFPAGRVRIDDLFAQSAQESIEVIVTSPGYAENRVADVRPIGGQDLDLGILRLWR